MEPSTRTNAGGEEPAPAMTQVLLACGIAASLLYVAMNVIAPMQYEGYSVTSQTISELSAIGAPTRPLWLALGTAYIVLVIAFGLGVWRAAGRSRPLRIAGVLLISSAVIGLAGPPMHQRGEGFTLTDTLHIVFTAVSILLFWSIIGFGAAGFGRGFRIYSIATIVVHVVFGTLAGIQGPRIAANLPTPWVGVAQRINTGVYMLWLIVFAVALLRARTAMAPRRLARPRMIPQGTA